MDGGDQHALRGDAHHHPGGQVHDGDGGLAHQLLGLIVFMDAAEDGSGAVRAVVQGELQQLLALADCLAGRDLHRPVVGLGEGLKVHRLLKEGLDLHVGEVDLRLLAGDGGRGFRRCFRRLLSLSGVDRLHRRDFKLTLFANQFFLIYLYFQSTFVSRPYYTFTPIRMSFVSSGVSIGVKWRM